MEIIWIWKNALLTSKILAKMEMKLYGNHMEMEKCPSDIENISYDGNETVWKSYGNGKTVKRNTYLYGIFIRYEKDK